MAYSLEEMEEYLQNMYEQAGKGLEQKAVQYMLDFQRLEEQHKRDVAEGKWTQEQFDTWRKNKLLYGTHWTRMIQTVQRDMAKVNQTALDYINGKIPQIFAQTYNEVAEKVPKSPVSGYSFELVNADTVKNLINEEGIILPPKKNLDKQKDKLWNAKQVNAQLLQGILQGESIKKIAARMQNVANADLVGATRTARTMCTAAENSGRQSAYNRAAKDGINFNKTWLAALQGNTRDTHKYLNQQTQPHDKPFESSSGAVLMFPGDWHAPPAEVYNCRCTMITKFVSFDKDKLHEAVERQRKEAEIEKQNNESAENSARAEEYIRRLEEMLRERTDSGDWKGIKYDDMDILIESIQNCPEYMANVILQTMPNCKLVISEETPSGGTYYSPSENCIYIKKDDIYKPEFAQIFWHEYSHYLDHAENSKSPYKQIDKFTKHTWARDENGEVIYKDGVPQRTTITETYERSGITAKLARQGDYNSRYQEAVVKDVNNFLSAIGMADKYEMRIGADEYSDQWLFHRDTGEAVTTTLLTPEEMKDLHGKAKEYIRDVSGLKAVDEYIYTLGYPKMPNRDDYYQGYYTPKRQEYREKEKYKGADEAYHKAVSDYYEQKDKFEAEHDMDKIFLTRAEMRDEAERKATLLGFAFDSLDGGAAGAFLSENIECGGHSAGYYLTNNHGIMETVANVGATEITQDKELIEYMKQFMPEQYELVKEVLRDVT